MLNLPLGRNMARVLGFARIQGGTGIQCRAWLFYSTCFELSSSTKNEIKKRHRYRMKIMLTQSLTNITLNHCMCKIKHVDCFYSICELWALQWQTASESQRVKGLV
jgi:hypothetical protein